MTTETVTEAYARLPDAIGRGKHATPEEGACVLELVSLFAGEPFSDHPACACPVVTAFAIRINDAMPDDATRTRLLGPLVRLIAGSRRDRETEVRRGYVAADFAIRVFAPLALEARGRREEAARLRAVPPVRDRETALAARKVAAAAAACAADVDAARAAAAYAAAYAYAAAAAYAAAYAARSGVDVWSLAVDCLRTLCETE